MSTFNDPSLTINGYVPCAPDAFAVFKRGDKALALYTWGNSDWIVSGGPPQKGVVYVVRDYHFGLSFTNRPELGDIYGQILHLEGIICDRVATHPQNVEMGWFHGGFRKVTEEEARAAISAEVTLEVGATP